MQSQQKKIKWSRGETADALEERTDTGITQVSVSRLENIISDVYGNIARRPALKVISSKPYEAEGLPLIVDPATDPTSAGAFVRQPQSFVFTIDANTYILFILGANGGFGGLLIQNNQFIRKISITNNTGWSPNVFTDTISTAQYNNFMIVSNLYIADVVIRLTGSSTAEYGITVEKFQFAAPWYAPNGTQTKTVNNGLLTGLEFNKSGHGFTADSWTDPAGNSTPCSFIDTGLTGDPTAIEEQIPLGSIIRFPNIGAYMRVEGYSLGSNKVYFVDYDFDSVITTGNPPATGLCCRVRNTPQGDEYSKDFRLIAYRDGVQLEPTAVVTYGMNVWVRCSASQTGYKKLVYSYDHDMNTYSASWQDAPSGSLDVMVFGPLLTPAANDKAKDTSVTVEYGYVSLNDYQPTKFTFSNQRLYAGGFYSSEMSPQYIPGYAVGSQIAKYTDFKNDYNTQSEAVPIDISTSYQEKIVAMVDYNGLKIFTDAAEYAYSQQTGVVKQSENGALEQCKPLVFGSVCLYADKSGRQIRAVQYELQTNLFNSSTINQMTQEDLVFNTVSMGGFYDKEHYAGHFLFAVQAGYNTQGTTWTPIADHSLAVCNLVPGNQAATWGRWTTPKITRTNGNRHSVGNIIEINNKVWFIVNCVAVWPGLATSEVAYTVAELDYDSLLDFESTATSADDAYYLIQPTQNYDLYAWKNLTRTVYTKSFITSLGDPIFDANGNQVATATNNPSGPRMTIDGVDYYEWDVGGGMYVYTKDAVPTPTGEETDPSRQVFDSNGDLISNKFITGYNSTNDFIAVQTGMGPGVHPVNNYYRVLSDIQYDWNGVSETATYTKSDNIYELYATLPGTVSIFDGDEYKWDDTTNMMGKYNESLSELTNPRVGFMVNAVLESHPIDTQGKTYTEKKRIGKCVAVIRNTEPDAFTVCEKTGYTSPDRKVVNFYGCTGMKDLIRYTIRNKKGAKFIIESLTMITEYGTLES